MARHTPKTFEIKQVHCLCHIVRIYEQPPCFRVKKCIISCMQINGQLEFVTYDEKIVIECDGKVSKLCRDYPETPRPAIYNDIWSYDLGWYAR